MMSVKIKQTDESRNTTTTLTDDSELSVALEAGTTYFIDIVLTYLAGATPDFQYAYVYTGTITNALTFEGTREPSTTASGGSGDAFAPCYNLGGSHLTTPQVRAIAGSDAANTVGGGHIRGVIVTNSAGNLKLQWAQFVSNGANVTVQKGSYIAIAKQADMDGTLIVKGSDTSRANTTTLAADPDLQFPTKASSKYIYELHVLDYAATTAPDVQFALHDAQAAQALGHVSNLQFQATGVFGSTSEGAVNGQFKTAAWVTTPTIGAFVTSSATVQNHHHIHGSHVMAASDSTLAWEWAQNASSATATVVRSPSWMLYEEIFQDTLLVPPLAGTPTLSFAATGTLTSPPGATGGTATLAFAATATGTRTRAASGTATLDFTTTATGTLS